MTRSVSIREKWVTQSEIRNMSIECARVGGINLSQGVCDTEVPEIVRRAACQAVEDGYNTYTRYDGLAELRDAISLKYRRLYGLATDPEREIVVSAGATGAFYCACLALLNPGDEVILFEPYYGYHVSTLIATEAVPVFVSMKNETWTFTGEDLEQAVTAKTRAIMINTPANPSGKVFSRGELEIVAAFAAKHDLFVFTDEIYEHFIYDGSAHISPATLEGMRERTITISGLSKTFSITMDGESVTASAMRAGRARSDISMTWYMSAHRRRCRWRRRKASFSLTKGIIVSLRWNSAQNVIGSARRWPMQISDRMCRWALITS